MRIQHNIMAMNAYRNYTNNVSAMKANLEKLSSGYKINRAGDDAAGLAISEKMRAQITGLETAQKNAKDGISLVQTAEGALTEVHDMLNRMVELATQSANGTYDNTTDRAQMQKEVEQLKSEINRIADSANFNGIQLLDGSMSSVGTLGVADNLTITAVRDGEQTAGAKPQKGEYTFDLGELKIAAATGDTLALSIANVSVVDYTLTANDIDSDGIVKLDTLKTQIATASSVSFTYTNTDGGNLTFAIEMDDSGKVTLTGKAVPSAAQQAELEAKTALTINVSASGNNGWDQAVHIVEKAQAAATSKLAQGSFTLTAGQIVDGAQLIIGNETYTFKVGKDGSGTGGTVIDLSAYEAGDASIATAAANLLSTKSNTHFDITADGKTGKVYLTEKAGKVDYKNDWDLKGEDNTTGQTSDATWKNTETGIGAVRLATPGEAKGKSLQLQIGDTAKSYNQLKVDIKDMHAAALGIGDINIGDQDGAAKAVDIIKNAINQVSDVRGTLGATQNRLDHTINNLAVMTENIQDAESTIRDVDVAEEMMAYTKNNILIQSAQAMLAQANQVPQGVLQLLQ